MNINAALRDASAQLTTTSDTPELDARLLLQHALNVSHEHVIAHGEAEIVDDKKKIFDGLIKRRAAHEPLAYILGVKGFWRDQFFVTPDTLIPRPDSETVMEAALKFLPEKNMVRSVVDLGTGSGCLLLSALREYESARGVGLEITASALGVAQKNAQALGLESRAEFR